MTDPINPATMAAAAEALRKLGVLGEDLVRARDAYVLARVAYEDEHARTLDALMPTGIGAVHMLAGADQIEAAADATRESAK